MRIVAIAFASIALYGASPLSAQQPRSFRVQVTGTGRPIIFIPGLASSGETWNTSVARYRERFTCHVLTLAGFAGVPPIDEPLIATAVIEVAQYIRSQRLDRPVVVGHSLGGVLALTLAARHPGLIGSLVIVDSLPFTAGSRFQATTLAEAEPAINASHSNMLKMTRAQYEDYVRSGAATNYMVSRPSDHDTIKQWSLASDQRTVADALAEFYRLDLREEIGRIEVPTLVLGSWTGIRDQVSTFGVQLQRALFVRIFAEQFARLRRLHVTLSDSARHFIMFDDPAWFFRQLDDFLADPDRVTRDRGLDVQ